MITSSDLGENRRWPVPGLDHQEFDHACTGCLRCTYWFCRAHDACHCRTKRS